MARLRQTAAARFDDSADSDYAPDKAQSDPKGGDTNPKPTTKPRMSPRKKQARSYDVSECDTHCDGSEVLSAAVLVPKSTPKRAPLGRQIQLKPLGAPLLPRPLQMPRRVASREKPRKMISKAISVAVPPVPVGPSNAAENKTPDPDEPPSGTDEVEIEQSIWCGSDGDSEESEEELPSPRKLIGRRTSPQKIAASIVVQDPPRYDLPLRRPTPVLDSDSDVPPLRRPTKIHLQPSGQDQSRPTSSSDKENLGAFIRFSPPRLALSTQERPVTPPQSPSKQRLQSPSKTRTRIPTPPLRESLDGFWNADTVNDWNEQHSPRKVLKSPKKTNFYQSNSSQSPTSSPRKASPSKRSKAEIALRTHFSTTKNVLATTFLAELDAAITSNQISHLSASTGGVRLIWSKTLNSTAGRANWRKETTKTRHLDGSITNTAKHFASIELAEKVIDDEHRLLNVLAHEFCHLANFMISGIKDQPHGRQFKAWGAQVTTAFKDRGVEVTTKHSYEIEYRFVWQCENEECGAEFKRHSKSIDPKRKVCGSCRGRLVQVRPVPRREGVGGGGYAAFVKEQFAEVKKGLPGASQKVVMEALGRKYREEKEKTAAGVIAAAVPIDDDLEKVTGAMEVIVLDDQTA